MREDHISIDRWSRETYGSLEMHAARRELVVRVNVLTARNPSGTIASTSRNSADRQAMYGFVASDGIDYHELVAAQARATARRSAEYPYVVVPIDGSSITVTDRRGAKGIGRLGSPPAKGRGIKTMAAIARSPDQTPLGLLALHLWARPDKPRARNQQTLPIEQRETVHWLQIVEEVQKTFAEHGGQSRPWFQLDREGDFAELLMMADPAHNVLLTVRAKNDRPLAVGGRMRSRMKRTRPLGAYALHVTRARGRRPRVARMVVRATTMTLVLAPHPHRRTHRVRVNVVHAREVHPPSGIPPIDWLLITTAPIDTFELARLVINNYASRWGIEEFHRTWKTGLCNVESMQLRSFGAIARWATMLAGVAMRAAYLADVAREKPDDPATDVFSRDELEALIILRKKEAPPIEKITVAQAVRWVADYGGYVGNKNSGRPGKIVVGRGLAALEIAVAAIAGFKRKRGDSSKKS